MEKTRKMLFSSECVTKGHPDKLCDQIADGILDELLRQDPKSHVACEVCAMPQQVHIFGEIASRASVDYEALARDTVRRIGYTETGMGFDCDNCKIEVRLHEQSADIAAGVDESAAELGAGDQGMMFGFVCRETESLMPFAIEAARALTARLTHSRESGELPFLLPDGKAQITAEYCGDCPVRIDTVVLSAQHMQSISTEQLRAQLLERVIRPALPAEMLDENTKFLINPTGRFVVGGPAGDSGLTGRKIICDTYGGYARHGGGAFSGKDPTKVDRSAAYMARYIAKNIVAAGLAKRCELQLSYAIGCAQPVSVLIDSFGTCKVDDAQLESLVKKAVDLRPAAIIERLNLRRPIYAHTAEHGHFGLAAQGMPWESTDLANEL